MPQPRILLILLLLNVFSVRSQAPDYNRKEIITLTDKAEKYLNESKFSESLFYSREALKQAIAIKDDYLIATAYNTIAGNFDELSENDKAIANYKKALFYATRIKNDSVSGWLNNNLGNMYFFEKKQYDLGIDYYKKAIAFADKAADTSKLVLTNLNIAMAYFEIGQYDSGFPYLHFINKHHKKYGDASTMVYLNMLNGIYCGKKGDNEWAEKFFSKAIAIGIKNKEKTDLSYTYQEYSRFLKDKGDYEKAYKYLTLYDALKDEIYDSEKLAQANIEGVNLEIDEYKRSINKIESEKQMQALSLEKSKIIGILFFVIVLILLIMMFILIKANIFRKKTNAELLVANNDLILANSRAEEASLLKSQFVSTISHELRTPLYGVVGITNMILDEHKELADSPHLKSLKFSARYLLSLVNDILQINKIEEKRVVLEMLTFNIADEITLITNSLQFIANKNNNNIVVDIDSEIPEFLIGDKMRFSQILMNLVSNALKFTNDGEVMISAHQVNIESNNHFIEFKVRDSGIGIAKEDQDKIFDKFVQIRRKDDDYQGTGLGLAIVKKLVELFKSELYLESAPNQGTTFTFTIGFEADDSKIEQIINNIEVDLTSGQIFKVLVVEDNNINRLVTRKIIEKNQFLCDVVEDGFEALKILEKETYDIILMDINMPGINGFETTKRIRKMGLKTPVVALTAFDKDEITEQAISSGINDIIIKPFDPVKLFRIINIQITKAKNAG